jgi:hypothetical protein
LAMAEDELDHLLEAFAADRLSPDERRQLHAAAMSDQRLLCALADEQALKEVLRDPGRRARLLLELQTPGGAWRNETPSRLRPWMWIAAGSALLVVITILIGTELYQDRFPEHPPRVERDDSGPTLPTVATPGPELNPVTPVPEDHAISPPIVFNEPDADRPTARRIPAPFTGPMIEEHVVDDEIGVPSTALRKQEPERPAPKNTESLSRSKTKPPVVPEPELPVPQTAHDDAMPPPAEPASPPLQQAALATPSVQGTPVPHGSSARTLFYGQHKQAASAAALRSDESDQTSGSETEQEALVPSALPVPLAIRYSLVMAGQDGTDHEVDPETPVSLSDRPRLAVQTNQDGYLLVSEVPSSSEMAISPPAAAKPVHARTTVTFPVAGLITDPEANPVLRLRLSFSSRLPDSKHLLTQTSGAPLEERVEPEHAVYVAATGDSMNPMLIVDLDLNQRP